MARNSPSTGMCALAKWSCTVTPWAMWLQKRLIIRTKCENLQIIRRVLTMIFVNICPNARETRLKSTAKDRRLQCWVPLVLLLHNINYLLEHSRLFQQIMGPEPRKDTSVLDANKRKDRWAGFSIDEYVRFLTPLTHWRFFEPQRDLLLCLYRYTIYFDYFNRADYFSGRWYTHYPFPTH